MEKLEKSFSKYLTGCSESNWTSAVLGCLFHAICELAEKDRRDKDCTSVEMVVEFKGNFTFK